MKNVSGAFIPDETELNLLRAALYPDSRATDYWSAWKATIPLDDIDQGSFHIIPLLYRNLVRQGVPEEELKRYKGVYRYFWVHTQNVTRAATNIISTLNRHGIETLVVKGMALRHLYYGDPYSRTFGDFDLLVKYDAYPDTLSALYPVGLEPLGIRGDRQIPIRHAANFRVTGNVHFDLHWHLIQQCCYQGADDAFWDNAVEFRLGDVTTKTLCDTDHLLHTIIHASHRKDHKLLRWVCDVKFILDGERVDWHRFTNLSKQLQIAPPVSLACRFLQSELGLSIPAEVVEELGLCRVSPYREKELALYSEQRGPLSAIPLLWFGYQNRHPDQGLAQRLQGFVAHLRAWCGADTNYRLCKTLLTASIQRIPGFAIKT